MTADRLTLGGMALGVTLLLQPWWAGGFRYGFFITLIATAAQIVVAHRAAPSRDINREPER